MIWDPSALARCGSVTAMRVRNCGVVLVRAGAWRRTKGREQGPLDKTYEEVHMYRGWASTTIMPRTTRSLLPETVLAIKGCEFFFKDANSNQMHRGLDEAGRQPPARQAKYELAIDKSNGTHHGLCLVAGDTVFRVNNY
jgi:hypothetical protein